MGNVIRALRAQNHATVNWHWYENNAGQFWWYWDHSWWRWVTEDLWVSECQEYWSGVDPLEDLDRY